MSTRRKSKASEDGEGTVLAAAAGIIGNILQAIESRNLRTPVADLRGQAKQLLAVLREWQVAHSQLRIHSERQEQELQRLRGEVALLHKELADAQASAASRARA